MVRTGRDNVEKVKGYMSIISSACDRQIDALDGLITDFTHVESFCLSVIQIIDDKMRGSLPE